MNRTFLVWFAFFGVFAAGAITGGFVAERFARSIIQKRASEQFTQQQFRRVADQLGLNEEQRDRILPVITSASTAIQRNRRENLAILEKMEIDIRSQLNEEQIVKFDHLRARQRENERVIQRWLKEQRTRRQEMLNSLSSEPSAPAALHKEEPTSVGK